MRSMKFALALIPLSVLAVGLGSSQEARPKPAGPPAPVVGERAPAFRLNDHTGRAMELPVVDDETWTVIAFFPKAATPG